MRCIASLVNFSFVLLSRLCPSSLNFAACSVVRGNRPCALGGIVSFHVTALPVAFHVDATFPYGEAYEKSRLPSRESKVGCSHIVWKPASAADVSMPAAYR